MADSSTGESLIQPKAKRGRSNENEIEENKDWLSELPDSILLHILSLLKPKAAVQTCMLSSRWKDLWKRLPILTLISSDFYTFKLFTKFVSKILTLRDGSIAVEELDFERVGRIQPHLIKRVVNYAVSRNVQRLRISVEYDMTHLLPCIFTCHTLTSLELDFGRGMVSDHLSSLPKSLINLPALTTLHLSSFQFSSSSGNDRADPFSAFTRLNCLTIEDFDLPDARILCISSATLVNLTICNFRVPKDGEDFCKIELSTPCLHRFTCYGLPTYYLSGCGLSSVKEVYMDITLTIDKPERPLILLSWLQNLLDMTSLTVTTNTLQVLFLVPGFLKMKLPTLANLKIFKVKKEPLSEFLRQIMIERMERQIETAQRRTAIRLALDISRWKARKEENAPLPEGFPTFLHYHIQSPTKVEIIDCAR